MRRALFAREFRSALVPNLVTVGAILVTLVAFERFYGLRLGKAEDVRVFIDIILLAGLVVSGFISGERCFPADFKESRIFFLSSLPLSRTWSWLIIVSARLFAALLSSGFAVVLRHPLLGNPEIEKFLWWAITLTLFFYGLFFSAGTLFSLLFRRTFISYVAGFILLGILIIETLFSSSYAAKWPTLEALVDIPAITFEDPLLPTFLIFLILLLLFLSCRFFICGELGNLKRRIHNQILFGITAAAYLGFVFCAASSTNIASLWSTWRVFDYRLADIYPSVLGSKTYGVSANGRYLFLFESSGKRPFMVRVNIVDNQTGRHTYQSVYGGVVKGYWSEGNVLSLLALNNSPLDRWGYLVDGSVDWIRLSPNGREISRLSLKGIEEVSILDEGRALAVLREGDMGRVGLLDGTSGQFSEIVRAPLDGKVEILGDGLSTLIYFENIILPRKAWIIDSQAHEIPLPQSPSGPVYVFSSKIIDSFKESQAGMIRRFNQPLSPEGSPIRGNFVLSDAGTVWSLAAKSDVKAVYFIEEVPDAIVLWARSTVPDGQWEKLPSAEYYRNSIDHYSGIGAFRAEDTNAGQFFIYDPQLGFFFEGEHCDAGDRPILTVDRVPGLKGILMRLTCMKKPPTFRENTRLFEYFPGSGKLRTIKVVPARSGGWTSLYLDERGGEVWASGVPLLEIWRSSPGAKDLRIWPPQ